MRTIKLISALTIIVLSFFVESCKKKDNATPDSNDNTLPVAPSGNYAVFLSRKQAIITTTLTSAYNNFSIAYVSNTALVNNNPSLGSLLDMGTVSLNGTTFKKNVYSAANMYGDTTTSTFNTPHNWDISGTASVPSFSFSNTNAYPTYSGYNAIADSFIISSNISIPLNNYSGSDEVETYFVTSTNPVANTTVQNISGSPTTLNFTSTDLGIIGINSNVSLVINFYKNNVQTINGKSYNFRTGSSYIKSNIKFK